MTIDAPPVPSADASVSHSVAATSDAPSVPADPSAVLMDQFLDLVKKLGKETAKELIKSDDDDASADSENSNESALSGATALEPDADNVNSRSFLGTSQRGATSFQQGASSSQRGASSSQRGASSSQ